MKVEVEELSPVQRKLWVEVPSQEVDKKLDRAYRTLGKKAKVKGFRPGKAPRTILERLFKKRIEDEVSQELFRNSLDEALKEVNLHPLNLQLPNQLPVLVPGDDFRYTVEVEVPPEFSVENYLGLPLENSEIEVTENMVEQRLEEIRQYNATLKPISTDRPVMSGDYLLIEYEAFREGNLVTGGGAENQTLEVGTGEFNADFEQHLLGMTRGQVANFQVELPQDFFNPLLAGNTVDFQVKIKEIKEKEIPSLTDAFAQNLGGKFQTLDDLRQSVKQTIIKEMENQNQARQRDKLLDILISQIRFEVPPSLVRQEQERLLGDQLRVFQARGLNIAGLDYEKMLESLRELAERRSRAHLILQKVADQEGITINNAEMEDGYQQLAARTGEKVEQIKEFYQKNQRVEELRARLREEKTMTMLIDNAKIIAPATVTETAAEGA